MVPQSLREFETVARQRLGPAAYDFYAGGAGDEVTLRANEAAFRRLTLRPRVLRGAGTPDLRTTLLGDELAMPVFVSPTAFHRLADPAGECATAQGTASAGVLMIVSMASTVAVEELTGLRWFQLYPQPDRGFTAGVIRRAERAGCTALVVSVDSPVFGRRERDLRNGFTDLPPGMCCENMRDASGTVRRIEFMPDLGWQHIDWLLKTTSLPVLLKGVVHPDDARLAVDFGVAGLIVSNHGGRQLDGMTAAIDALPAVVDAVAGRLPVLVDGGVRRGTDVVKALALGATAVGLGRPVLWGLAAAGQEGVSRVLTMIRDELAAAVTLCGYSASSDLPRDLVLPC